jgi:hypothetical protein
MNREVFGQGLTSVEAKARVHESIVVTVECETGHEAAKSW